MEVISITDDEIIHHGNCGGAWYHIVDELIHLGLAQGKRYALHYGLHTDCLIDLTDIGSDWQRSIIWSRDKGWWVDAYQYDGTLLKPPCHPA